MPTWAEVPPQLRLLARWITIAQAAGYGVGLALSRENAARFAAAGEAASREVLLSAHTQLLALVAMFAISSAFFALCPRPQGRARTLILTLPFLGLALAFTAVWLMKYSGAMVWLLLGSMLGMTVLFYIQISITLRSIRKAKAAVSSTP